MRPLIELDDEVLLHRLLNSDVEAFNELYLRYVKSLYNYAYKISNEREKIEDIIQETFIELWAKRTGYENVKNIKAYIFGCVRNKINRSLSLKNTRPLTELNYLIENFYTDFSVEETLITDENLKRTITHLQTQFKTLSKREYEALHLRFYEDLSFDKIAEIMDITTQSARNTINKALIRLRQNLPNSIFLSVFLLFFS